MTPPPTEQERAEALRLAREVIDPARSFRFSSGEGRIARALLDADQRITDLTLRERANAQAFEDSECELERVEAQLAACREALREIRDEAQGYLHPPLMRIEARASRALSDGESGT